MNIVQDIKNRINKDNHNTIFYDIYNNYDKYNFINREYTKNYLLIVFSELFDIDIDLDLINNENIKIQRIEQEKFRQQVVNRFETCIISDIHQDSCQAAHIYDLKYEPLNYDLNNGILLSATLHLEFDKLKWCIDPNTYNIVISKKYCMQNLEINKYINNDIYSKLKKYPHINYYLCLKYQKFMNDQYE
jgi:hypothetical protein